MQHDWDQAEADRRLKERIVREQAPAVAEREAPRAAVAKRQADAQAERDAAASARIDGDLRRGYFADPSATEESFAAALPELREERRRRLAVQGDSGDAAARAAMRRLVTA